MYILDKFVIVLNECVVRTVGDYVEFGSVGSGDQFS